MEKVADLVDKRGAQHGHLSYVNIFRHYEHPAKDEERRKKDEKAVAKKKTPPRDLNERPKLETVKYESTTGTYKIKVSASEQLCFYDQHLLITLLSLIRSKQSTADWIKGEGMLDEKSNAFAFASDAQKKQNNFSLLAKANLAVPVSEIAKAMGLKKIGEYSYLAIKCSLIRLSKVTFHYETYKYSGNSHLLESHYCKDSKVVTFTLNPLSSLILDNDNESMVIHRMEERNALPAGICRGVYSILVSRVKDGKIAATSIFREDLICQLYGSEIYELLKSKDMEVKKKASKKLKNRYALLDKHMDVIINKTKGWTVSKKGRGRNTKYLIKRPPLPQVVTKRNVTL